MNVRCVKVDAYGIMNASLISHRSIVCRQPNATLIMLRDAGKLRIASENVRIAEVQRNNCRPQ